MLKQLTDYHQVPAFIHACGFEHVFGSKVLTALRAYGLNDDRVRFYLCEENGDPTAAMYLMDGVLVVSAHPSADPAPVAELVRRESVGEVDTNWDQCAALQALLGGAT